MNIQPFSFAACIALTSTTSNQTTTVPDKGGQLFAYNGAVDTVYLKWAASVAAAPGTWTDGVTALPPGTTQVLSIPPGGQLAYIATATGGALVLGVGYGV